MVPILSIKSMFIDHNVPFTTLEYLQEKQLIQMQLKNYIGGIRLHITSQKV